MQPGKIWCALKDDAVCADWPEYARKVVWYGRRGGKNLYTAEIKETAADGE